MTAARWVAAATFGVALSVTLRAGDARVKKPAQALAGFVVMQVLVGVVNLLLAAPTALMALVLPSRLDSSR